MLRRLAVAALPIAVVAIVVLPIALDQPFGALKGRQLRRVPFLEEYWFDWKTYHPSTDVARHIF